MKYNINVFVKLRVPDLWASTAKKTIVRSLGYTCLADIAREDIWHFCIEEKSKKDAEKYVEDITKNSNLFVNPNKHSYRIQSNGLQLAEAQEENTFIIPVVVYWFDNTSSVLIYKTLKYRLQYKNVQGLKGGVLWWLKINTTSRENARKIAKDIIVCKTRKTGLLVNPHVNYYKMF